MNKLFAIVVGGVLLVLLLLFSTTYSVAYNEVAIKTRFAQVSEESIVREPGWHLRLPVFADRVAKYDTRLQLLESPKEQIATADGQPLVVQTYLLWKVDENGRGPLSFDESYGSIDAAQSDLLAPLRTAMGALSRYNFNDLIGAESKLAEAEAAILEDLSGLVGAGIEPVSVGVSQMLLPPNTTKAVLGRMQATRQKLAEGVRFRSGAEAQRIQSAAATEADKIRTFAETRAAEIRARGEAEAARYLEQMSSDEELAIFLAWLDALEASLGQHTTLVVPTTTAPWHLMNVSDAGDVAGVPQPAESGTTQVNAE